MEGKADPKIEGPPPTLPGAAFLSYRAPHSICFDFCSMPERGQHLQPWIGRMIIKAISVPQLMRDGLFMTEEDVMLEEGYRSVPSMTFSADVRESRPHSQNFFLRDRQHEPPRWMAKAECVAAHVAILDGIRLRDLSHRNISACLATVSPNLYAPEFLYAYEFIRQLPHIFFSILGDEPLEGLWPHPKRPESGRAGK